MRGRADRHARPAQQAAAVGGLGSPARRAMRLMLALCAAAVALGTVLGMVAIVVELGNGEIAKPLNSAGGILPVPATTSTAPATDAASTMVRHYHGPADTQGRTIKVKVAGSWRINWSFTCPAGKKGHFALKDTTSNSVRKSRVEKTGQGTWSGNGPHNLLVTSNCQWKASLLPHRRTSGPTHSPSPTQTPSTSPAPSPSPTSSPPPSPSPSPSPHHTPSPNPHHTHHPTP
jgi:cell division septation protein DedD